MSKPVTDRALVAAWPGSGLPNTIQSRSAHGAKTTTATTPATPMRRSARGAVEAADPPRDDGPGQADPERLVAGQRGQADEDAEADEPRVGQPRAARVAGDPRHQQAGAERQRRERHRRVRQRRVEDERQVDRRGQAACRGPACGPGRAAGRAPRATSAASRQARTGTSAPTRTDDHWAAAKRHAAERHRRSAARNVGSGSQTSKAGRGKTSGGVP